MSALRGEADEDQRPPELPLIAKTGHWRVSHGRWSAVYSFGVPLNPPMARIALCAPLAAPQVAWAKSLPDVQRLVQERARATRRPGLMDELRGMGAWDDIGALKAWLRDDLVQIIVQP